MLHSSFSSARKLLCTAAGLALVAGLGVSQCPGQAMLIATNVGNPVLPGSVVAAGNGYDVAGAGRDIGTGTSDQFQFNYEPRDGDFDVKVRVAALTFSDVWTKAGLMARETFNTNSRYAATFATPTVSGCFFQSRSATNSAGVNAGSFPISYPNTWLRLQRAGNLFTGYASFDGENWGLLGSVTLGISNTLYLGLAVSSRVTNRLATAQFRDYVESAGAPLGTVIYPTEPLGPSSRKTGLAISEIMYRPAPRPDGQNLEFIELYNSNPFFEDISGYKLTGDVDFTFPEGTIMAGGGFLVLAKNAGDVQAAYGLSGVLSYGITNVTYTNVVVGGMTNTTPIATNVINSLSRSGTLRLRSRIGAIYLEVPYSNDNPWPVGADGTGHSLVLARPSYGEGYPQAWGLSTALGGSPGGAEPIPSGSLRAVMINELLTHTDVGSGAVEYVELYNHSSQTNDLSGCVLTDDAVTNKFIIPPGTKILPGGFIAFDEAQLGFSLAADGETVYFKSPDFRVLDAVQYEPQANGVTVGRFPDGAKEFYALSARTPGAANAGLLIDDIVLNEIMYKPLSGDSDDEYIELYNKGVTTVNLGGWKFTSGINFTFPTNTLLGSNAYLVVARNVTNLLAKYPSLGHNNTVGNYGGSLANRGERLALARPERVISVNPTNMSLLLTSTVPVVVAEVTYGTGGRWGTWANEGGSSLELIDPNSNPRLAYNWADSDETAKAPWTLVEATGRADNGSGSANFLEFAALGEGEWLMDDVQVMAGTNAANLLNAANSSFESGLGTWNRRGNHIRSSLETSGGFSAPNCLHIRASARGDSGANRLIVAMTSTVAVNQMVTIRARVRWLRGWPEVLLRLHGNYHEAVARLNIPPNLGTPGARNSRAVANAGPAIYEVSHAPVLPVANQALIVSARVSDFDGLASLVLNYRVDPAPDITSVPMNDSGTDGDSLAADGIYSATVAARPAGSLVVFTLTAMDVLGHTTQFPAEGPNREIPLRFGDPVPASGFGTYRLWLTRTNASIWANRPALSNERIDGTFVYGNVRAVYNVSTKFSGSPYHQGFGNPTNNSCHYSMDLPLDDLCLGTENFNKVHAPGNGPWDDTTLQREQACYWMVRQMGLPWNYRRSVNFIINGYRRSPAGLMEDTQTPGNDVIDENFPDDPDGQLFKLQPWFEVDDGAGASLGFANNSWCTMNKYTTTGGAMKTARYRWNYLVRAANGTANDYTSVFDLVRAANNTNNAAAYVAGMEELVDIDQWLRTFAIEHAVGNWDSFGAQNSQNMYGYKPQNGRWQLMIWDYNIVLGNSGSWGPGTELFHLVDGPPGGGDTAMAYLYRNPVFRRAYWSSLKDVIRGPMAANSQIKALVDAKYAAYQASGLGSGASSPQPIKDFIDQARVSIATQLAQVDATNFVVFTPTSFGTNNNFLIITGRAPVEIRNLTATFNGAPYPLNFSVLGNTPTANVANWSMRVILHSGTNRVVLQGYDRFGNALSNTATVLTIDYTGPEPSPQDAIVINEIMYRPLVTNASYVEIYNTSSNSFDLSNWRLDGVGYTFPFGSILAGRSFLVLARSIAAYGPAYPSSPAPFAEFPGELDANGETLTLVKTGATAVDDVVVDRVHYEPGAPWPTTANGQGPGLQLIDATIDNARPSDWSDGAAWRYVAVSGTLANVSTNFLLFLGGVGEVYLDDIVLVAGTNANTGPNLLVNGDFEAPLSGPWFLATNMTDSAISTNIVHSGSGSLHVVSSSGGSQLNNIRQDITPPSDTMPYTLSYWFRTSVTGSSNLTARVYGGSGLSHTVNIRPIAATPNRTNSILNSLPAYPLLWLNEVQANNVTGPTDRFGQHEPWIELHNSDTNALDLSGYYLANNYTNLSQWQFPAGARIQPGQFLIVFADGQPEQSDANEWHTSFALQPSTGAVALARPMGLEPQVMDYLNYAGLGPDQSYGDYPDGQPFERRVFNSATPAAPNPAPPPVTVFINEWMASNVAGPGGYPDPGDGNYDDWMELYNPGEQPANIGGFYLTDNLTNKTQWRIPDGTIIPAGGYKLVWADDNLNQNGTGTNGDLHANFRLGKDGEAIGLFAVVGTAIVQIDAVTFGPQTNNLSQGRYPDGNANVAFLTMPTPRASNFRTQPNTAPVLQSLPAVIQIDELRLLQFTLGATDQEAPPQRLTFSLAPGAPLGAILRTNGQFQWRPNEQQGPGTYPITVRVTDDGTPPLSDMATLTIAVNEVNSAPVFVDTREKYVAAGSSLLFPTAVDFDLPANTLSLSLGPGTPQGVSLDPLTGLCTWTPEPSQVGTNRFSVRAQDNGTPSLMNEYTFTVRVLPADPAKDLIWAEIKYTAAGVRLSWSATVGRSYRVEYVTDLSQTNWTPLGSNRVATGARLEVEDNIVPGVQRCYRIVQLD